MKTQNNWKIVKNKIADTIVKNADQIINPNFYLITSLLVIPVVFGWAEKTEEMGIIIVAISIGLIFNNLDKIKFVKASPKDLLVEMEKATKEAEVKIEQLKELADSLSKPILMQILRSGTYNSLTPEEKLEDFNKIIKNIKELEIYSEDIESFKQSLIFQKRHQLLQAIKIKLNNEVEDIKKLDDQIKNMNKNMKILMKTKS